MSLIARSLAQEQASAAERMYHLHGVVVNALTGSPIERALVQSSDQHLAALTDREGRFAFDVRMVPQQRPQGPGVSSDAGSNMGLFLMARKPGYLEARDNVKSVPLDESIASTNIQLKLMPSATIDGHVSASGPDVPRSVRVMLLVRQEMEGSATWATREQQFTNSRGEFRFFNLRPGEYSLVTVFWPGDQLGPHPLPNTITQEYAPVYLGDVPDVDSATKIHLHNGETARAEFHIERVNFYPVTIPIAPTSGNVVGSVMEQIVTGGYSLSYNARAHVVKGFLPAGTYNVMINNFGDARSCAILPIHVDGVALRTSPVTLLRAANIPVHVRTEFTSTDHEQSGSESGPHRMLRSGSEVPTVSINLLADERNDSYSARNLDGQWVLENVPPGTYHVQVGAYGVYAASMTAGGLDLTRNPLIVASGSDPGAIDVLLRDDMASISGTVTGLDDALGAYVQLLPVDGTARFAVTSLAGDGKFLMSGLAPGTYRVLAFREAHDRIAYRDEATMRHFEGKGATVTLTAGQSAQVDVAVLESPEVEEP